MQEVKCKSCGIFRVYAAKLCKACYNRDMNKLVALRAAEKNEVN
jgi:uncharacterized OB-fold protein